jgi:hypothetical protein
MMTIPMMTRMRMRMIPMMRMVVREELRTVICGSAKSRCADHLKDDIYRGYGVISTDRGE